MLRKVYVWGDSIAEGNRVRRRARAVRGPAGAQRVFPGAAEALHVEMGEPCALRHDVAARAAALENGLQSAEPGSPVLLSFGGNDVDYDWAAISETPKERHDPRPAGAVRGEHGADGARRARRGLIPVLLTLPPIDSERYFPGSCARPGKGRERPEVAGGGAASTRTHRGYSRSLPGRADRERAPDRRARRVRTRGDSRCRLCVDGIHPNAEDMPSSARR